jgi:hypothetical protein
MNAIRRFEDWVSTTLEDRLGALLGGQMQPIDLARRLAAAMEDHRVVGAGKVYVPNTYRLYLAPWAFTAFAGFQNALQDELALFLGRQAHEAGYKLVGRPRVQLLVDTALRPEKIRVEADLVDRGTLAGTPAVTQAIDLGPAAEGGAPDPLALELSGNRRVRLDGESLTVGRALDNDVIVPDATVSRHHARFVRRGEHWLLEDLNSTHGSFLNGHRVTTTLLRAGDEVRLGSAVVRLSRPLAVD